MTLIRREVWNETAERNAEGGETEISISKNFIFTWGTSSVTSNSAYFNKINTNSICRKVQPSIDVLTEMKQELAGIC